MPKCLDCDAEMQLGPDTLGVGDFIVCSSCGVELRVVGARPLALEPVLEDDPSGPQ